MYTVELTPLLVKHYEYYRCGVNSEISKFGLPKHRWVFWQINAWYRAHISAQKPKLVNGLRKCFGLIGDTNKPWNHVSMLLALGWQISSGVHTVQSSNSYILTAILNPVLNASTPLLITFSSPS